MREEKRKFQRHQVALPVYLSGSTVGELHTKDFSLGGIFISSPNPLAADTRLSIRIEIPQSDASVTIKGIVVHSIQGAGMGVRFTEMPIETKDTIIRYLESLESTPDS